MPLALARWLCLLAMTMAPVSAVVYAQDVEPNNPQAQAQVQAKTMRNTCKADYTKFCPGGPPSIFFEQACLKQAYTNLSTPCRHALDNMSQDNGGDSGNQ
jgi:hypothetical protein